MTEECVLPSASCVHGQAIQGRAGVGALTVVLIALMAVIATNYLQSRNSTMMGETVRMMRHQQSAVLLYQAAQRIAAEAADPDGDGYREVPAMRSGGGPVGGGLIPLSSAAGKTDGWTRPLGYCTWDYGDTIGSSGRINPGRLSTAATEIVLVVLSAGADGRFETVCPADPNGVVPVAGGDDLLIGFTSAEVAQRASLTDEMLAFLNALISGAYRPPTATGLDIAGTLTVGSGLAAGSPALVLPDGLVQALGRRLSQAVYDVTTARAGDVVLQPTCPTGLAARVYTAFMHIAANDTGQSFSAAQSFAQATTSGGRPAWLIRVDIRTPAGWMAPTPVDVARVMVVTKCE